MSQTQHALTNPNPLITQCNPNLDQTNNQKSAAPKKARSSVKAASAEVSANKNNNNNAEMAAMYNPEQADVNGAWLPEAKFDHVCQPLLFLLRFLLLLLYCYYYY